MPFLFVRPNGDRVEIEGADARHLARSLRVRPGERLEVVDPGDGIAGRLLTVRIESVTGDQVVGTVEASRPHRPEPRVEVRIALALLPAAALESALARCTELGAAGFLLIAAERSVGRLPDRRSPAKLERLGAICREAAMLAGRLRVPTIEGPLPLAAVASRPGVDLVLLDRGAERRLAEVAPASRILGIGPEGGWSGAELRLAPVTAALGPRNLRAENAAPAALTVALAASKDV